MGTTRSEATLLHRCGVSEVTTALWTLPEDAEAYAAAGFGAIGVWLHKLEQPRLDGGFYFPEKHIPQAVVDSSVEAVRASGLAVSHVVLGGNYLDEAKRGQAIEHTLHALDISAALGAACLVVNPGRLNGLSRADGVEAAAEAISEVLERRRAQVRLAIEPVVGWQSDFVNTLGQALDVVDAIGHPDVGVYPDSWQLWETGTYYEDVARAGARIFGYHLNDGLSGSRDRLIPGDGEIPLVEMVRAAEAAGYRGTYDVELTTPMTQGAAYEVPYDELLERCAAGMTTILADAGVT